MACSTGTRESGAACLRWYFSSLNVLVGSTVSVCCVLTSNFSIIRKLVQTLPKVVLPDKRADGVRI